MAISEENTSAHRPVTLQGHTAEIRSRRVWSMFPIHRDFRGRGSPLSVLTLIHSRHCTHTHTHPFITGFTPQDTHRSLTKCHPRFFHQMETHPLFSFDKRCQNFYCKFSQVKQPYTLFFQPFLYHFVLQNMLADACKLRKCLKHFNNIRIEQIQWKRREKIRKHDSRKVWISESLFENL